jgi:hypothetical protein
MPSIINSDDGVVSGSSGLKTTGGNDGITNFQQNGTTQASITAAGLFQFNSGYGSVATAYGCRAWVNFNGTGTVAIRASGNVTSITDNGTGDYTVNFTTAMPDANYTPVCLGNRASTAQAPRIPLIRSDGTVPTTSALRVEMVDTSSTGTSDQAYINIAIFR